MPLSSRSRGAALAVLSAGTLMIILDGTIVTVALPSIQRDLGFSQSALAWVVNAYLIAFGGLLLLSGRLGDILGRRRILVGGLTAFTAASLACGLADSAGLLITARFVQGAAGAMVSAVSLGMVIALYPDPAGRGRAMGVYSFVQSAGGVLGLVAGGVLTQAVNWHWIFFVNLPIGAAAALLSLRLLPDDRPAAGSGNPVRDVDAPGALLVTAALMLGVYTIVGTADHGWASARTGAFGAVSLVLLAGFLVRQSRAAQPLMPLRLFRSRLVTGANVVQALMVAGGFGFQFLVTLYLQRVLGYDPLRIGLAIAPTGLVIGVMSLALSARLGARFGERAVLLPSLVLFACGFLLLARVPAGHASYVTDVLPATLVFGVAFGLAMPALMTLGMSDATPADSGLISGVFNTAQQIGAALGLAVLAALASARTDHLAAAGHSPAASLTGGYHLAFLVAAGLLAAATLAAALLLKAPVRGTGGVGRTGGRAVQEGHEGQDAPEGQDRVSDQDRVSASRGSRRAPEPTDRTAHV
ncbi:DHA2 family efflux MFS transporter permease subunit [Actinacidiphila bryophytorum]|uniref:Drug resistance transporter, EmrB/QacA subfamily n=1 Tax=Actinacidiphila bryophytorum TaxID=1436133 RepID=A0A9W4H5A4_9ACTN|nr:DHA2 family efflux MFS transporter permease subunit [Actinacidiphila bryophytorum]CAG7651436.1 Drug resistance transporter, EmrB/QacA subfamily [Actinacidiphila bryophytorum]